jgi:hypothetical protein
MEEGLEIRCGSLDSVVFLWVSFRHFAKDILKRKFCHKLLVFPPKKWPEIATIAYERVLHIFYFHIFNIVKFG